MQKFNPSLYVKQAGRLLGDKSYSITRENSKTTVFLAVTSGTLLYEGQGRQLSVKKGETAVIRSNTKYTIYSKVENPPEMLWLNISGEMLEYNLESLFPEAPIIKAEGDFKEEFLKIIDIIQNKPDFTAVGKAVFSLLFDIKSCRISAAENREKKRNRKDEYENYITRSVHRDFSVGEMAEYFSISVYTLNKEFKRLFGQTPYNYYQKIRIDLAKSLLKNCDISIDDIASRLNFTDRNYFSLYFKKQTGISPARFRKDSKAL